MHALVHHFQIKSQPTKRIPDPQKKPPVFHTAKRPTKNTNTRPSRHSTHLITNPDNTAHLILRTQTLPNLQFTVTSLQHIIPQAATDLEHNGESQYKITSTKHFSVNCQSTYSANQIIILLLDN